MVDINIPKIVKSYVPLHRSTPLISSEFEYCTFEMRKNKKIIIFYLSYMYKVQERKSILCIKYHEHN